MKVEADFVCEHAMPQPWATCADCMLLPHDMQPQPPAQPAAKKPTRQSSKEPKAPKVGSTRPKSSAPRPSTRLPRSTNDTAPELFGDKDLAYEIPPDNLRHHIRGVDNGWLPISTMPHELRSDGWVYLQTGRRLVARGRVAGIEFRERRWTHEEPGQTADAGPGAILNLSGRGWEAVNIDLGPKGDEPVRGYRYLITEPDDSVRLADPADS